MRVAILDSGIFPHIDLREKIIYGKNFTSEGNSQNVEDNNGHGTHVAGIIHDIIPEAQLLIVKVLDRYGKGNIEDVTEGIYYAIEKNVDIINISISFEDEDKEMEEAIQLAKDKNIPVICAAGNNNVIEYPAQYGISAGSLDPTSGNISEFCSKDCVIYAPGENVTSTYLNDSYETMTGTSMATAKVTGYIAKEIKNKRDIVKFLEENKYIYKGVVGV